MYQNRAKDPADGCLLSIFQILLLPIISFGIGWVAGWFVEVLFLGDPYMTPTGFDMKVLIGFIMGGLVLAKYALLFLVLVFAVLADMA